MFERKTTENVSYCVNIFQSSESQYFCKYLYRYKYKKNHKQYILNYLHANIFLGTRIVLVRKTIKHCYFRYGIQEIASILPSWRQSK